MHLEPLVLFDIARNNKTQLTDDERTHLGTCDECQRIVLVFARQFVKTEGQSDDEPKDAA